MYRKSITSPSVLLGFGVVEVNAGDNWSLVNIALTLLPVHGCRDMVWYSANVSDAALSHRLVVSTLALAGCFFNSHQHRGYGAGASTSTPSRSSHLLKAIYEQNTLLLNQVSGAG